MADPLEHLTSSRAMGTSSDRLAFLVLSGSFNPIHAQHVLAMDVARSVCERLGWNVIRGFLAPSSEEYVREKLGDESWSLKVRTSLCELATMESDWISVYPHGALSGYKVCLEIGEHLKDEYAELLRGRSAAGVEVMGSDTAIRILDKVIAEWRSTPGSERKPWYQGRRICCLVRPGRNSSEEADHIRMVTAPQAAELGVDVMLVNTTGEEHPLAPVSSSEIRALVARRDWDGLRVRGWLQLQVLDALEAWASNRVSMRDARAGDAA